MDYQSFLTLIHVMYSNCKRPPNDIKSKDQRQACQLKIRFLICLYPLVLIRIHHAYSLFLSLDQDMIYSIH